MTEAERRIKHLMAQLTVPEDKNDGFLEALRAIAPAVWADYDPKKENSVANTKGQLNEKN